MSTLNTLLNVAFQSVWSNMHHLTIVMLITASAMASQTCESLVDDCEYYTCIEKDRACGKRGYPIGFGRKYCNKFGKNEANFSSDGKKWIESVKSCLIENISYVEQGVTCDMFKKEAIAHHVPCYLDAGYCDLSKKDKREVIKTIKASMWRVDIILAGFKVITSCQKD